MQLYTLDPLREKRWDDLVASHPRSSVFHQVGWLRALAKTYGYQPIVLTTASPGTPLLDGIVFCQIRSWMTGRRLVSLPFSDHADPLLNGPCDYCELQRWIQWSSEQRGYRYVELRPLFLEVSPALLDLSTEFYWWHTLDLRKSLGQLFHGLHKDCFQRRIRHAERELLEYERGDSEGLIHKFYKLLVTTRRRHRILPQPRAWFLNLIKEKEIRPDLRLVSKNGVPAAALLCLRFRDTVIYKYGCSDEKFHHLGGMPYLFWRLIEESRSEGANQIDLGRTGIENRGLVTYKDRLGASCKKISYLRYPPDTRTSWTQSSRLVGFRRLATSVPGPLLAGMGRLAYRHFG